jgi:hypothetical protein
LCLNIIKKPIGAQSILLKACQAAKGPFLAKIKAMAALASGCYN